LPCRAATFIHLPCPSRRPVEPRINCHRPPHVRSDRLILAAPILTVVAVLVAIGAVGLLIAERSRKRAAKEEISQRDAMIEKLTGDATALRSILQDYIQQREASEEVLRRGEERYRALVDNLTTVVFQADRDLRWTFLNPAWETVTGRSPAESVSQLATTSMVEDDAAECDGVLRALLDGRQSLAEQVVRVRCVAGNVHWLELRAIPMLDPAGDVVGVSGTLSDVTSRVSVEVELRRQQTLYRLIAENSSDIIALISLHGGRFTYVSPSVAHVLGFAPEEVLGVEWWTLLDPADRERIASSVQTVSKRQPVTETARVRRKDGTWVWLEARADAVEEEGTIVGYRVTGPRHQRAPRRRNRTHGK
jgi:PAS domain S-box-containing protein